MGDGPGGQQDRAVGTEGRLLSRHPRAIVSWLLVAACLAALPRAAAAQGASPAPASSQPQAFASSSGSPLRFELDRLRLIPGELTAMLPPPQPGSQRDSLKNGVLIGAAVGAIALGGFAAILCNALQEPGDPGCLGDTLRIAAVGAAIGAGAGLAVDAVLDRGGVRVSIGVRF